MMPPNCMSTVAFIYPHMPLYVNGMIPPFAGTAAAMSGILAGAKAQGLEDYHVVGFAGDGGTADIGLQALSGMIDRNDKAIFICYDNEAYMNTGVQKSRREERFCRRRSAEERWNSSILRSAWQSEAL